jgi:hypothetical protein
MTRERESSTMLKTMLIALSLFTAAGISLAQGAVTAPDPNAVEWESPAG